MGRASSEDIMLKELIYNNSKYAQMKYVLMVGIILFGLFGGVFFALIIPPLIKYLTGKIFSFREVIIPTLIVMPICGVFFGKEMWKKRKK